MPTSFSPLIKPNANLLILGSLPGKLSLKQSEYYAHPRNAFWSILEELYAISREKPYIERTKLLMKEGLALWDVIHHCERASSLDSDILQSTVKVNDFRTLFRQYTQISRICFNGKKAEKLYRQHVFPSLKARQQEIIYYSLPSTSPAMASLTLEKKTILWKQALLPLKVF